MRIFPTQAAIQRVSIGSPAGAGGQATGVGAVIADALQMEEPALVRGQRSALAAPTTVEVLGPARGVFVNVGRIPIVVAGEVTQDAAGGLLAGLSFFVLL